MDFSNRVNQTPAFSAVFGVLVLCLLHNYGIQNAITIGAYIEIASRVYEDGDGVSCGAIDGNDAVKTATITLFSGRSGRIFIVIAVFIQFAGFERSDQ
jgi:hypothetical protein